MLHNILEYTQLKSSRKMFNATPALNQAPERMKFPTQFYFMFLSFQFVGVFKIN